MAGKIRIVAGIAGTDDALDIELSVAGISSPGNVSVFRYSPADLTRIVKGGNLQIVDNMLTAMAPAQSISLVEIPVTRSLLPPAAYLPLIAR